MGDLAEVLLLMHGARNRFHSLRLEAREWRHAERGRRAFDRHRERRGDHPGAAVAFVASGDREATATLTVHRVWWTKPDRLREETEPVHDGGEATIRIVSGERWAFLAGGEIHSSAHAPGSVSPPTPALAWLLDPAPLLAAHDLEIVGRARVAGREGIRVVARRREMDDLLLTGGLPLGADEHELVVDASLGILLRVASRLDDEDFAVAEITELALDEDMPDDRFVLVAPPDARVAPPSPPLPRPATREVTLAEAARTAPFTVLVPARLPDGWRVDQVTANVTHPAITPQVILTYRLDDGRGALVMIESAAGSTPIGDVEEEPVERDGRTLWVAHAPHTRIRLERDGTDVRLTGDLRREDALAVAASFGPLPAEPAT